MELQDYVGKYGVLNDEFKENTSNNGNKYHKHCDRFVQVTDIKETGGYPLLVSIDGELFNVGLDEINLFEDNDLITHLEVGQEYEYYFGTAIIQMIDYKNRKMQLKYADNSSEVVDIPKVKQTPIREIPVINLEDEMSPKWDSGIKVISDSDISIVEKFEWTPLVEVDEDMVIHKQLLEKLHEVIKAKRSDYGDSFGKQYDEYGILSALIRLEDKLNRLKSLTVGAKTQQVNDESIYDTALDLIGYGSLLLVKLEKEKQNVN